MITGGTASDTASLVTAASGEYVATAYIQCTSAGSAGTLDVYFTHTDDVGALSTPLVATIALDGTNSDGGLAVMRCAGGSIDYFLTVTADAGSPVWSAHLSLTQVR